MFESLSRNCAVATNYMFSLAFGQKETQKEREPFLYSDEYLSCQVGESRFPAASEGPLRQRAAFRQNANQRMTHDTRTQPPSLEARRSFNNYKGSMKPLLNLIDESIVASNSGLREILEVITDDRQSLSSESKDEVSQLLQAAKTQGDRTLEVQIELILAAEVIKEGGSGSAGNIAAFVARFLRRYNNQAIAAGLIETGNEICDLKDMYSAGCLFYARGIQASACASSLDKCKEAKSFFLQTIECHSKGYRDNVFFLAASKHIEELDERLSQFG